jgi:hypothetical protein
MTSVLEAIHTSGVSGPPFSGLALVHKYGVNTFRAVLAAQAIADFHLRTGGNFGPLGEYSGSLREQPSGTYTQNTQLGKLTQASPVKAETFYSVQVFLAAVKCFGTQDSDGTDSTYAVVSLIGINPLASANVPHAQTIITDVKDDNVHANDVIFTEMQSVGICDVQVSGIGVIIHAAILDHEAGDPTDIKNKIHDALEAKAIAAATAITAGITAKDQKLTGAVGDIQDFEILGFRPFHILFISDLLNSIAGDDFLGEHAFRVPAADIVAIAPPTEDPSNTAKFLASFIIDPDFHDHPEVKFNWPPLGQEFLFSDGHGSYKIYFVVQPSIRFTPVLPP